MSLSINRLLTEREGRTGEKAKKIDCTGSGFYYQKQSAI